MLSNYVACHLEAGTQPGAVEHGVRERCRRLRAISRSEHSVGKGQSWDSQQAFRERHLFGIRALAGNAERVPATVSKPNISVRHLVVRIVLNIVVSDKYMIVELSFFGMFILIFSA